jgi:Plastocyanin
MSREQKEPVMRLRIVSLAILILAGVAASAAADDVYLAIGGSVGVFKTDTRIFNPSFTTDLTVTATFTPAGNPPAGAAIVKTIPVAKRSMVSYDDVVASLFQTSGLGATKLSSSGAFYATQRIYANTSDGTLGQFLIGEPLSAAKKRGVLIQLRSTGTSGTPGTFRSNIGFLNPNATAATVTMHLYDKQNAIVGAPAALILQPNAVVASTNVTSFFTVPTADLSDAWISFDSSVPIFVYGSVIDNGTSDPTFIPPFDDVDAPVVPPPPPSSLTVVVGPGMTFTPSELTIKVGDTVQWQFRSTHTSTSDDRTGSEAWDSGIMSSGTFSRRFTHAGTYSYYCSLHSVPGGTSMNGVIIVEDNPDPYPY